MLNGSTPDAVAPKQVSLPPAEIKISRGPVVRTLVLELMIIELDECLHIGLQRVGQVMIFQHAGLIGFFRCTTEYYFNCLVY
jgi:hypothetical protein